MKALADIVEKARSQAAGRPPAPGFGGRMSEFRAKYQVPSDLPGEGPTRETEVPGLPTAIQFTPAATKS